MEGVGENRDLRPVVDRRGVSGECGCRGQRDHRESEERPAVGAPLLRRTERDPRTSYAASLQQPPAAPRRAADQVADQPQVQCVRVEERVGLGGESGNGGEGERQDRDASEIEGAPGRVLDRLGGHECCRVLRDGT